MNRPPVYSFVGTSNRQSAMYSRLQKFLQLDPRDRSLLLCVWLLLGWFRLLLRLRGLSYFTDRLTACHEVTTVTAIQPEQVQPAKRLGHLVAIAARYTPWHSSCLTQVLVVQRLLVWQYIPGRFSLGVRKTDGNEAAAIGAHAWLQCGDVIVSGDTPNRSYTTLTTFGWDAGVS